MQRRIGQGPLLRLAICLLVALPLLAACDTLLDAAGLERKSNQDFASAPPEIPGGRAAGPQPGDGQHSRPASSKMISGIQRTLNELGYDAGPVDGITGPRTEAAIRHFQSDANLPVDGRGSPDLSAVLLTEIDRRNRIAGQDGQDRPEWVAETAVTAANASPEFRREGTHGVAAEPYYEVGDNYIYSNGRIETAVRIEGGLVHWVANDGSRYMAMANFVLPPVEWENGNGAVESTVESSSSVTWPPAKTDELMYVAKPVELNASQYLHEAWSGEWRCGAGDRSTLDVAAGTFDVVEIACEKTSAAPGEWRRRVWFYAPEIRHFVRKKETTEVGGPPALMDLVAILPDRSNWTSSARSGFNWAVQKLLDRGAVGDKIQWTVADSGIEFDIILTGEMDTVERISCRRYMVIRKKPGHPRMLPAVACRDGATGRWKIPVLEKGSIPPVEELASR